MEMLCVSLLRYITRDRKSHTRTGPKKPSRTCFTTRTLPPPVSARARGKRVAARETRTYHIHVCVCVCANVSMSPPPILFPAHIAARAGAYSAHNNFRSFPPPIRGRRGHCIIRPGVATQHLGGGAERAIPGLSPHTHPSLPPSSSSSYSHRLPFARSQPAPPFSRRVLIPPCHTHTPPSHRRR